MLLTLQGQFGSHHCLCLEDAFLKSDFNFSLVNMRAMYCFGVSPKNISICAQDQPGIVTVCPSPPLQLQLPTHTFCHIRLLLSAAAHLVMTYKLRFFRFRVRTAWKAGPLSCKSLMHQLTDLFFVDDAGKLLFWSRAESPMHNKFTRTLKWKWNAINLALLRTKHGRARRTDVR